MADSNVIDPNKKAAFSAFIRSLDTDFEAFVRALIVQFIPDVKQRSAALDAAGNLTREDFNTAEMYLLYNGVYQLNDEEYWRIAEKQRDEWARQLFQALGLDRDRHKAVFTPLTLDDYAAFSIVEQTSGKTQEQLELTTGKTRQQLTTEWREERVIGACKLASELANCIRRSARSRKQTDFFS